MIQIDRTEMWVALGAELTEDLQPPDPTVPVDSWAAIYRICIAPLIELIRTTSPSVVAISGPPGAGKSTVSAAVCRRLNAMSINAIALSMDDFYYSLKTRKRLGIRWRAVPGSHDLDLMVRTLQATRSSTGLIKVPRFDAAMDDRRPDEQLESPPSVVVFDGWFLGYSEAGYEDILPYFDWHIHLDLPPQTARERRFLRERLLRERTGHGFDNSQMEMFWSNVLEPGIDQWVQTAAQHADITVYLDPSHYRCFASERLDGYLFERFDS